MIIFRYLSKEILTTLTVITVVLVLIFLSNQFIRYLGYAADGRLFSGVLFNLMLLEIPNLIALLLPLGLFLGILLAYGRLYVDNEMTVMAACGVSQTRLTIMTITVAIGITLLAGALTFWVVPHMFAAKNRLLLTNNDTSMLATLLPGRFQAAAGGREVFYVEQMSRDRKHVRNVFVAQHKKNDDQGSGGEWTVYSAKSGYQFRDKATGDQFVVITDGYRYQGVPGQLDYRIVKYGTYGVRVEQRPVTTVDIQQWMSMRQLWEKAAKDNLIAAEFQWRLSIPLMAFLLALLAVPFSRVRPRQGRYAQLLPAILVYVIYANMMFVGRAWVADGTITPAIGMWWIHGLVLLLTVMLWPAGFNWSTVYHRIKKTIWRTA